MTNADFTTARISVGSNTATPLLVFFTLAYLIGWSPIPVLGWLASEAGLSSWTELSQLAERNELSDLNLPVKGWLIYGITRVQDFAFSLSGLLVISFYQGNNGLLELGKRLLRWRLPGRCWLVVCLPLLLYLVAASINGALGSFQWSTTGVWQALFSIEAGLVVTLLARGPMGEELGLRGFALPYLQSLTSPFKASLIIGLLWAFWHLPVLIGRDPVSLTAFLLLAVLLSFVFTWVFNNSSGSLVGVLLLHAFQNNEESFEVFFTTLAGTDWELLSTIGLLLFGIGFAIAIWRDRERNTIRLVL